VGSAVVTSSAGAVVSASEGASVVISGCLVSAQAAKDEQSIIARSRNAIARKEDLVFIVRKSFLLI
jgi:hypothetical protein